MRYTALTLNIDGGSDRYLPWKQRKLAIIDTLFKEHTDFFCLQEATSDFMEKFTETDKRQQYDVYWGKCADKDKYNPIIWRNNFTVQERGSIYLGTNYQTNCVSWDACDPVVLTWVLLNDRENNILFYCFNVHLDSKSQKSRDKCSDVIIRIVKELSNKANCTSLLMGDFNSRPVIPENNEIMDPFHIVLNDFLPIDKIYDKFINNGFEDAYLSTENKNKLDMNTYHDYYTEKFPPAALRIDWVLKYTPDNLKSLFEAYSLNDNDIISDHYIAKVEIRMESEISNYLYLGKNQVFKLCDNGIALTHISNKLKDILSIYQTQKKELINLIINQDYREIKKIINDKDRPNECCSSDNLLSNIIIECDCLEQIFDYNERRLISFFVFSPTHIPVIKWISEHGKHLSRYIVELSDVPSCNAVFQAGIIKKDTIDGTDIIIKKSNKLKPNKLFNEIKMYQYLKSIFSSRCYINTINDIDVFIEISMPAAIINDNYENTLYSIMESIAGKTMDEILIYEMDADNETKRFYLKCLFLISNFLLSKSFLWCDLSPRNIIVVKENGNIIFNLIDFEKSYIDDSLSFSLDDKKAFFRGQICAEELCTIFRPIDVADIFGDLFDYKNWDYNSQNPIPNYFRPEVKQIIELRNLKKPTMGDYNTIDSQMIQTFQPQSTINNLWKRYPGRIKFKTEHYLNCVGIRNSQKYETKVAEIMIHALHCDKTDKFITLLHNCINELENNLLIDEFDNNSILDCSVDSAVQYMKLINNLYSLIAIKSVENSENEVLI